MIFFKSQKEMTKQKQEKMQNKIQAKHNEIRHAARAAKNDGRKVFQYMDVLSGTTSSPDNQLGGRSIASPIEVIEEVGWKLVDIGYVYQQTIAGDQHSVFSDGEIMGIYTFRIE